MEDFQRLEVYEKSRQFARNVYAITSRFPFYIRRGFGEQLNSAAESIGSNIAEGAGRKNSNHGNVEFIRYCHFSFGSACEAQHRIGCAFDRQLITESEHADLVAAVVEVKKMLAAFINALRKRDRGRIDKLTS